MDRLKLLDRIADRVPELDLDRNEVEWHELPDGHQALTVDGGGFDGGSGTFFANAGDDLRAVGSLDPLAPGHVGCVVIRPDCPVNDGLTVSVATIAIGGGF